MRRHLIIGGGAALLYLLFLLWYGPIPDPLTEAEVEAFIAMRNAQEITPEEASRTEDLRQFLLEDDGRGFFMVNLVTLRDVPLQLDGFDPDASAGDLMAQYFQGYMARQFLSRAGWLVVQGPSYAGPVELWNAEERQWAFFAVVRYRSRRDLMEIVADPRFSEAHPYKFAAVEATSAFPAAPGLVIGPRLVVLLIILVMALLADKVWPKRMA
ncbi:MAG: hypothetical protein AAFR65_01300 [Pseudomonadota bacterium]